MRVTKRIKEEYETLLKGIGSDRFFNHILKIGMISRTHLENPEEMMLDQSDAFFSLFRTTGNDNYFTIGVILRRAAHCVYRKNKTGKVQKNTRRFLNLIE